MMTVRIEYTIGWGVMVANYYANSWKELQAKIEKFKAAAAERNATVETVKYSYPSGKCFVKKGGF